MAREGLPVTLVSGHGASLGDVLIRGDGIGCLAFVGGRANGRKAATTLADTGRRHFLEQEGLNAWGIWGFTQWDLLGAHIKKGFEYGKQRCTAYPRYVVQRAMFAEFLQMYLPVVASLKFGHPLAVEHPADPFPELDFGPVISADKALRAAHRPSTRACAPAASRWSIATCTRAGSSTARTPPPTSPRPASCSPRPPGTCTTRSRSARSTRSSSWTPSRSSSPR